MPKFSFRWRHSILLIGDSSKGLFLWICEILKNTFFTKHRLQCLIMTFFEPFYTFIRLCYRKATSTLVLTLFAVSVCNIAAEFFNGLRCFYVSRDVRAQGAKGHLVPPTFWLLMFFIINDSEKKLKKCYVLKTEIDYHLRKKSLNRTNNISYN